MALALAVSMLSFLLSCFSFFYFRAFLTNRTSQKRMLAEFQEEVDLIIAGIDTATDRDLHLVEDRVKYLEAILAEADKRIKELNHRIGVVRREEDRQKAQEYAYAELGNRKASPAPKSAPKAAPRQQPIHEVPSAANPVAEGAAAYQAASNPAEPSLLQVSLNPTEPSLNQATSNPAEPSLLQVSSNPTEPSLNQAASNSAKPSLLRVSVSDTAEPEAEGVPQAEEAVKTLDEPPPADPEPSVITVSLPRIVHSAEPIKPKAAPLQERVAELYRAGFSADLIAQRIGASVAEVELAISLAEQRRLNSRTD